MYVLRGLDLLLLLHSHGWCHRRYIDKQWITGLILLDLSTTFSTVDHSILLCVCMSSDSVYVVLHSCGSHTVGGTMSTPRPVLCSVPWSSSAGQTEFTVYTEDVSLLFERLHIRHHVRRRHASVHRGASRRRGPSSNCAAGLHQPCQWLVHVQFTAVKRWQTENWSGSVPEPVLPSCVCKWIGPATQRRHHSSCHIRPRSWRTTWLGTDQVKARFQGHQHLLFSTLPSMTNQTSRRSWSHSTSGLCVSALVTWLL